jgi:predicted metal-dependent hydrolase
VKLSARYGGVVQSRLAIFPAALMSSLKYLSAYSEQTQQQVSQLIAQNKLGEVLLKRYSKPHDLRTDRALYQYVQELKNEFLRNAEPINKVEYDSKIHVINHALGLHTSISRVQGGKLKAKHEIRVATMFKEVPLEFLRMIAVHELAHVKEKQHDKAFYKLCTYMEPNYHQYEFDLRLYLTQLDIDSKKLWS